MTVCTRLGAALYLIHTNAVAKNPPDIFIGRNDSVPTGGCSEGFASCPYPLSPESGFARHPQLLRQTGRRAHTLLLGFQYEILGNFQRLHGPKCSPFFETTD